MSKGTIEASDLSEAFATAVWALVRNYVIIEGEVQAVHADTYTVDVAIDGAVFNSVPLKILIDGTQPADVELPTVGANVLMSFRDGSLQRPQVLMVDQTDTRYINAKQIVINGGQLGGLVEVLKLVERMNLIENTVNAFINDYNLHTHPVTATGTPTGVPLVPETGNLTPTQREDIENTKITQG